MLSNRCLTENDLPAILLRLQQLSSEKKKKSTAHNNSGSNSLLEDQPLQSDVDNGSRIQKTFNDATVEVHVHEGDTTMVNDQATERAITDDTIHEVVNEKKKKKLQSSFKADLEGHFMTVAWARKLMNKYGGIYCFIYLTFVNFVLFYN